jgi:hypothetical protein
MKTFTVLLLLALFSMTAMSQELPVIDNLSKLNQVLSNTEKMDADYSKMKKKDFSFTANPYLWTVAMGGTIGLPGIPDPYPKSYEVNMSFSDALSKIKMAFMFGGKLKYKNMNLFYDLVYANLKNFDAEVPASQGLVSANTTNKELIIDLSLGYSFPMKNKSIDLSAYAGARIWSIDTELTLNETSGTTIMKSASKTWVDPIVGINANFILSKKWFAYLRSDFGGFGVNSQFTFMVLGGFGYKFSPNWNTSLGLKNLSSDYDKDGRQFTVNQYGLILSLGYVY